MSAPALTISEAAELLAVHPDTLRRWCDEGKVTFWMTPGGQRRFRQSDIDAALSSPVPAVSATEADT